MAREPFTLDPLPAILLGPPGTGKTTELTNIIAEEIASGTLPSEIGLVTFTRAAAAEAVDRVAADDRFTIDRDEFVHFRTIHSMAARGSGIGGKNLLEGAKLAGFGDWIGEKLTGHYAADGVWNGYSRGDRMMFIDNLARIKRLPLMEVYLAEREANLEWALQDRFSRGLREYKKTNAVHDFTDMLEVFVKEGKAPRLKVLLVDEAQDLSLLQWDVVKLLAKGCERLVVAFDDDQAIHIWAGASIETALNLPGNVTVLGQSHRVPRAVQEVALGIIKRVKHRRAKQWSPRDEEGLVKYLPYASDIDFSGDDVMVLARNRSLIKELAGELKIKGIYFRDEGRDSVKASLRDAIIIWTRLRDGKPQLVKDIVAGPYEWMSSGTRVARGAKKLPSFDPGATVSMDELVEKGGLLTTAVWFEALDRIPADDIAYIRKAARQGEHLSVPPRVKLSTIHGSKGAQANHVILLAGMATRSFEGMRVNPDSEHRVFYVGASRAKQQLTIADYRKHKAYNFGVS